MVTAWVLYYRLADCTYHFQELQGTGFNETRPDNWGLDEESHEIILVLQQAQFLGAWIEGQRKEMH